MVTNEVKRISCVSYLNSLPFIHGLKRSGFLESTHTLLSLDIPSVCAVKMMNGVAEAGLLPVALMPRVSGLKIISDYCIGANGPVGSVMLFSDVPMKNIKRIMVDYQSRTSARLIRVLADELWKIDPEWVEAKPGFEDVKEEDTGLLIIGDRALEREKKFPYVYDLAEEWKKLTGLPFVFAVWMGKEDLQPEYIEGFNDSLRFGVDKLDQVIDSVSFSGISPERVRSYLQNNIRYRLDEPGKEAIRLFLEKTQRLGI